MELKKAVDFFFETGNLKRVKRSGWWLIGITDPENIAEHSFRAAVIGHVIATLEKADADKVMKICLFNDLHESRINDLHKVGQRYIDFKSAEKKAFKDQMEMLPEEMAKELSTLFDEFQNDKSKEGEIARDADLLECAVQAKEYLEIGYKDAQNWIDNVKKILKTDTAKKMLKIIEKRSSNEWWKDLKKIKRY